MNEVRNFFEEVLQRRQNNPQEGSTLLATELNPEDISNSMLLLNHMHMSDPDVMTAQLKQSRYSARVTDWVMRHGYLRAARIVLLVERMQI